jgi:hypothetical protein
VLVRSYSRHSRVIWCEATTETPGHSFSNRGERRLFMAGIGVGMQEADGDRLDALGLEVVEDRRQARQVERLQLLALVGDAAGQFAAQVARHEGLRLLVVEVEEVRPVAARDLQRVAKALGGDQADLDALALGQRVDDDGGAVGEKSTVAGSTPPFSAH